MAQAAVLLGICPAPLNLVLPPAAFARAEAGSSNSQNFRSIWSTYAFSIRSATQTDS